LGSNEGRTYYKLLAEFLRREKYLVPISKMRPLNRHSWGISVAMTLEDSGYFVLGGSYRSQTIANKLYIWTPARAIWSLAVSRTSSVVVPDASTLAKTEYPAARRESERKAVQTSVVIPARMTCFLPVASMAARNWGLSQALRRALV
jgi:hypothetical protein